MVLYFIQIHNVGKKELKFEDNKNVGVFYADLVFILANPTTVKRIFFGKLAYALKALRIRRNYLACFVSC